MLLPVFIKSRISFPDFLKKLYDFRIFSENYKILIEKELEFTGKNENLIKKYAKILYNQKNNNYNVSYLANVVDFKLLEQKYFEYKKIKYKILKE